MPTFGEIAQIAKRHWDTENAIIAVAVGAAESGEFNALHGDHISIFSPELQEVYRPYACFGYLSHGWLQVFAGVHYDKYRYYVGTDIPCDWSTWAENFDNAAYIAYDVWYDRGGGSQAGWQAWTMYNNGMYANYLDAARQAVLGLAPTNLQAFRPQCSDAPYQVTFTWEGRDGDLWIDLSDRPDFSFFANRYVTAGKSIIAPDYFSFDWQLLPDVTYYWRIFDMQGHTNGPNFTVPNCASQAPLPSPNPPSAPGGNSPPPLSYPEEADPQIILESWASRDRAIDVRQGLQRVIDVVERTQL